MGIEKKSAEVSDANPNSFTLPKLQEEAKNGKR